MDVFVINKNNTTTFESRVISLYDKIIKIYKSEIVHYSKQAELSYKEKNELIDVCLSYENMKEEDMRECYNKTCMSILERIRKASTVGHSEECIIRAAIDIFLKYVFDIEYRLPRSCCTKEKFEDLEFEILRDISWKII